MAKLIESASAYVKAGLEALEMAWNIHPKHKPLRLNDRGAGAYEVPDPRPIAPPVGYQRQVPLHEQIRAMVRSERLRQEVEAAGFETVEEADDFDVGDDFEPSAPYEIDFDPGDPEYKAPVPEPEGGQGRPQGAAEPAEPLDGLEAPQASAEPAPAGSPKPKPNKKG